MRMDGGEVYEFFNWLYVYKVFCLHIFSASMSLEDLSSSNHIALLISYGMGPNISQCLYFHYLF